MEPESYSATRLAALLRQTFRIGPGYFETTATAVAGVTPSKSSRSCALLIVTSHMLAALKQSVRFGWSTSFRAVRDSRFGWAAKPAYPSASSDYFVFAANLTLFAQRVREKFPSAQAVYTSSRSYGGIAGSQAARGEPWSYEEGHALNQWLLAHERVDGVWYGWGAYLWAPACGGGTNASGVCWARGDFVDDGVHPSASGQAKVSGMLHARWLGEGWSGR